MLSIFLMLNVLLFAFNLLPLPPLDGAATLGLVLPQGAAEMVRVLTRTPMFSLVGLLIAWRIFPFIAHPIFSIVLLILHPSMSYS
jgi:Zn-dependent protease